MVEDKEIITIKGKIINNASGAKGISDKGAWEVFNLEILQSDGKKIKVGSFNKQHNDLLNKYVEVTAMVKIQGKYTNYNLKTIKEQDGSETVTTEEVIEEGTKPVKEDVSTEQGREMDTTVAKRTPQQVMEEVKPDWIGKEKRSIRAMSVAYCKDLVVSDKIKKEDIITTAEGMFQYIWNGIKE